MSIEKYDSTVWNSCSTKFKKYLQVYLGKNKWFRWKSDISILKKKNMKSSVVRFCNFQGQDVYVWML